MLLHSDRVEFATRDAPGLHARRWLPAATPAGIAVIVHGLAEHGGRYDELAARLGARGLAVYALDHRGHGRSAGVRAFIPSAAAIVGDLGAFLANVRARHPGLGVTVIGHSFGGAVALLAALDYPARIDRLVLSAPAVATDPKLPRVRLLVGRLLSAIAPTVGILKLPAAAVSRDPAVVAAYRADPLVWHGAIPARTVVELLGAMRQIGLRAAELSVPVLVMHGGADALVPLRHNAPVYARLPGGLATLRVYEGLAHELFNEPERAAVYADLENWLDRA